MIGRVNSGDLLGGGFGRLVLAICVLATIVLLVPVALASIGFGAILGVASGLPTFGWLRSHRRPAHYLEPRLWLAVRRPSEHPLARRPARECLAKPCRRGLPGLW